MRPLIKAKFMQAAGKKLRATGTFNRSCGKIQRAGLQGRENGSQNFSKKFSNNCIKVQQLFAKLLRTIPQSLPCPFPTWRVGKETRFQGFRVPAPSFRQNLSRFQEKPPDVWGKTLEGFPKNFGCIFREARHDTFAFPNKI